MSALPAIDFTKRIAERREAYTTMPEANQPTEQESKATGYTQVSNNILRDKTISPQARLCYAILKSYDWENGGAWPSQNTLAEMLAVSGRMVRHYLDELETIGLITIKRRGVKQTNLYSISPESDRKCISTHSPDDRKSVSTHMGGDRKYISGLDRKYISYEEDSVLIRHDHASTPNGVEGAPPPTDPVKKPLPVSETTKPANRQAKREKKPEKQYPPEVNKASDHAYKYLGQFPPGMTKDWLLHRIEEYGLKPVLVAITISEGKPSTAYVKGVLAKLSEAELAGYDTDGKRVIRSIADERTGRNNGTGHVGNHATSERMASGRNLAGAGNLNGSGPATSYQPPEWDPVLKAQLVELERRERREQELSRKTQPAPANPPPHPGRPTGLR